MGEREGREREFKSYWAAEKAGHKYTLQVSTGELGGMESERKRDELLRGIPVSAR